MVLREDIDAATAPTGPLVRHESLLPRKHPLHRPRHGRRQRLAMACALVFFLAPAVAFVLGVRPAEIENHALVPFPGSAQGWEMLTGLTAWATDHLPLREQAVHAEDTLSRGLFGEPPPFTQAGRTPVEPAGSSALTSSASDTAGYPEVIEGGDGWLYYGYDVTGKCRPVRPLDDVIDGLARLRRAVEASGRTFVLVVAPDKSTAVPEHLPASYSGRDCATAAGARFWQRVVTEAGALDLRPDLRAVGAAAGTPAYYPQDTHWTDLGALVMLRAVAERLSPGVSATWRLGPPATVSVPADLPLLLGRRGEDQVGIYPLSPNGGADRARSLVLDLSMPVHLGGRAGTGVVPARIGLLGDSFSLAATRYAPAVFTDVTVVGYQDARGDLADVLATLATSRVVVVEVVERNLAAGTPAFLDPGVIERIRSALAARPVR